MRAARRFKKLFANWLANIIPMLIQMIKRLRISLRKLTRPMRFSPILRNAKNMMPWLQTMNAMDAGPEQRDTHTQAVRVPVVVRNITPSTRKTSTTFLEGSHHSQVSLRPTLAVALPLAREVVHVQLAEHDSVLNLHKMSNRP